MSPIVLANKPPKVGSVYVAQRQQNGFNFVRTPSYFPPNQPIDMFDRVVDIAADDQILLVETNLLESQVVTDRNAWSNDYVLYKVLHLRTNRTVYLRLAVYMDTFIDDKFFRAAHIFSIEFKALEDLVRQRG
jgi:hypothetical protein